MVFYQYDEQMTALKAWLAAPGQKGGPKFFADFLALFEARHGDFHDEDRRENRDFAGHQTHMAFGNAFVDLICGIVTVENKDYSSAQKLEIREAVLAGLDIHERQEQAACVQAIVSALLNLRGHRRPAASTTSTDNTDDSVPPSTGTDGSN